MVFLRQSANVATFNFDVRHKLQLFLTYTISVKRNNWKQIVATFAQRLTFAVRFF